MPRDGSLTPANLIGKLEVLRVECERCGRAGRYRVDRLVQRLGRDAKLTDWLANITADRPRKLSRARESVRGALPVFVEGGVRKRKNSARPQPSSSLGFAYSVRFTGIAT